MIQMTSKPYTQESPDTAGVVYIVEDDEAVSPFSSLTSECRA